MKISLNNRPLTYVEDDPEVSVLTPNAMIIGKVSNLSVEDEGSTEEEEMSKQARHTLKCKRSHVEKMDGQIPESSKRET